MTREHDKLTGSRMSGATLFLTGLSAISLIGCCIQFFMLTPGAADYVVSICCLLNVLCCAALFARRKELTTVLVEQN